MLSFRSLPQRMHHPPGSNISTLATCSKWYNKCISKPSKMTRESQRTPETYQWRGVHAEHTAD